MISILALGLPILLVSFPSQAGINVIKSGSTLKIVGDQLPNNNDTFELKEAPDAGEHIIETGPRELQVGGTPELDGEAEFSGFKKIIAGLPIH